MLSLTHHAILLMVDFLRTWRVELELPRRDMFGKAVFKYESSKAVLQQSWS